MCTRLSSSGEGLPNAPLGWCLNYNTIFKTVFQMGSISIWWFYHIAVVKHSEVLHNKNWEILSKPHLQINVTSRWVVFDMIITCHPPSSNSRLGSRVRLCETFYSNSKKMLKNRIIRCLDKYFYNIFLELNLFLEHKFSLDNIIFEKKCYLQQIFDQ